MLSTRRIGSVLFVGVLVALLVAGSTVTLVEFGVVSAPWTQDAADVEIVGDDGERKAAVDVEVADTLEERRTGLSDHDSLEEGHGMLFVHDEEGERTYVMREMDFDIDIIFIGGDREINSIHHARAPEEDEDGGDIQYSGEAKWVLEVPRGHANETGLEEGDAVEINYDENESESGSESE
ncbi:DUF192 domain-containing protein [Natrialbaceae archaeon GCM10025810]|uniref:DUF192 domain-containing protein n=1 Tax=Halovalidus salilacus TaxID=3075124 RepID=UPI003611EC3A